MSPVVVNLPQTDAVGMSECWLLKHCGDLHWQQLCASMGINHVHSTELCDDEGHFLYPTFVALRARYSSPLNSIELGDEFHTSIELSHFGRSFFHSNINLTNDCQRLGVEMLTTFAARDSSNGRQLKATLPRAGTRSCATTLRRPPEILGMCQGLRRGTWPRYQLAGYTFDPDQSTCDFTEQCEPSPYIDFNGVGLLYFASYPALADALERRIIRKHTLLDDEHDWALASSTVARDVFYHSNLGLGCEVIAHLKRFDRVGDQVILHTVLLAHDDGRKMADILTAKRLFADQIHV